MNWQTKVKVSLSQIPKHSTIYSIIGIAGMCVLILGSTQLFIDTKYDWFDFSIFILGVIMLIVGLALLIASEGSMPMQTNDRRTD